MALISPIKLKILQALREGPKHGYQLAMEVDISPNNIYGHIKVLETAHLIQAKTTKGKTGTASKVYSLTTRGRHLLKALT